MDVIQKENDKGFNPDNYINEKVLITKLEDLWQKEAMMWHQTFKGELVEDGRQEH